MGKDPDFGGNPKIHELTGEERSHINSMLRLGASRRDVLSWLAALGVSVPAAMLISAEASDARAATPKRGGRLVVAAEQHGPNDTLDPASFSSSEDFFRGRMFYGSLTRLTENLGYVPELAEEIVSNADATEWTFKLRKGVEFHDGKTLDADDVLYTMNRHLGPDTVSKANAMVDMITEWKKVGKYEVKAVLDSPNADLPIALGTFHFKIIQNGTTDFSTPAGTGPYKVKEFKPGVRTVGARFDNYWEDGGYLDELEHFAIAEPVARLNAFLAGEIDIMSNVPPKSVELVEATDGRDLWTVESGGYINIANRMDLQPSGNIHLVKAMQYLMDRRRLVEGVYKGYAKYGNDQPIGPAYLDHCPDIPQREMDLDKAKYHFDKSGIGSTAVPIVAAEVAPGAVEQCLFLQREAAKIGLTIDVKKVTTDGYWGAVWLKAPICVVNWNMRPTANLTFSIAYKSDAAWNESYWKNEQFDQMLVAVRGVTDADKRRQMYCDMQTIVREEAGRTIPLHRTYVDGVASHVRGLTYNPLNNLGGAEAAPSLWRADS